MLENAMKEKETCSLSKFRFEVHLGSNLKSIIFQEVSGLEVDEVKQIIEYRKSEGRFFSKVKMPKIVQYGNITLKNGVFVNDNFYWIWHKKILMNIIQRETMQIKLLDETGKVRMQWQLENAWPTKIISSDLDSERNKITIKSLEIAHENIIITNGRSK